MERLINHRDETILQVFQQLHIETDEQRAKILRPLYTEQLANASPSRLCYSIVTHDRTFVP